MFHVDIPTLSELKSLANARADACVSIYLPTTPLSQHVGGARITLGNLARTALAQLEAAGLDKRRQAELAERIELVREDDDFWRLQANSLALLVTPDRIRTWRLPNHLTEMVEVSDRFHLKPLLRAVTFPHHAFVLALAEGGARLIEVFSDLAAVELPMPGAPADAGAATGRASVNERTVSGHTLGADGQKLLLAAYARQVDAALRPVLAGRNETLVLAAAEPLLSIYRGINSYPHLADQAISGSPAHMTPAMLDSAARPVLDATHAAVIAAFHETYAARTGQGRTTADIAMAARAATQGAIDTLLVDIDEVVPGTVDDQTGAITLAKTASAASYGVVDEIAARALNTGATVLAVRRADIPDGASLAATLRYPV